MVLRVEVAPGLLEWAQERSRVPEEVLLEKFPRMHEWMSGTSSPTLKQLEDYASATYTPIGRLLLAEPPEESIPIPDFRTLGDREIERPSADLLDTVHLCQQRQEWFHDFARAAGQEQIGFVGSATTSTSTAEIAAEMRTVLKFEPGDRRSFSTWVMALTGLSERAESAGVLVMINGIVASNTYRKLDPDEFRGFALVDSLAPLVFINGADTKAAQIFTLAHELAHIWLGQQGLDDADSGQRPSSEIERWCSQVAAEFLVPIAELQSQFRSGAELTGELDRLARWFKSSTLVILRRIHDAGRLPWERFREEYRRELHRVMALTGGRNQTGGDFYNTTPVRTSKRFARALITSTLEGQTLYRDAARLLGFKNLSTLDKLGERLGVS